MRHLLDYTDSDGDHLCLYHDPLPDDPEDVWLNIDMQDGNRAVVRVPMTVLRECLS